MFAGPKPNPTRAPVGEKPPRADAERDRKENHHNSVWQALAVNPAALQPKLAIGQPNDPYEREADSVAERVMRMAPFRSTGDTLAFSSAASLKARRKCGPCEEGETEEVRKMQRPDAHSSPTASAAISEVLNSPGEPLDSATRTGMEERFGQDFSQVQVHTNTQAAASARAVNALAYTYKDHIIFGENQYQSHTEQGQRLLAHELTHVVQQGRGAGGVDAVQRFGGREHVRIGELARPGSSVLLEGYGPIPYGEMIAMAGDYFESLLEMQGLVKFIPNGREQIDFARWKVREDASLPRPRVGSGVEEAVDARFNRLAARNQTHFSTGSSPGNSNREQYIAGHTAAITAAYSGKPGWEAQEAFSNHFLTDAFSAGHVRTPRGQLDLHWNAIYPNFRDNLIGLMSCFMAAYINDKDGVGNVATVGLLRSRIDTVIRGRLGTKIGLFSFGAILSKAMHDADNPGLQVVSPQGIGTTSPLPWRAVGDENLFPAANVAATQPQQMTQQMTTQAVQLSYAEARAASTAGQSTSGPTLAALTNSANYRALQLLPAEDTSSITNPTYNWRQRDIHSLPGNIRAILFDQFRPSHGIRPEFDSFSVPCITNVTQLGINFDLHTEAAWLCFKNILLCDPFAMLVRAATGNLCPTGQNNPCAGPLPACGIAPPSPCTRAPGL